MSIKKIFFASSITNVPIRDRRNYVKYCNKLCLNIDEYLHGGFSKDKADIDRGSRTKSLDGFLFDHYSKAIKSSDLLLADLSYPSSGVGIELGLAASYKKPILIIASTPTKRIDDISRMVTGIPSLKHIEVFRSRREAIETVKLGWIKDNFCSNNR